jgi:hypothetical protein
MHLTVLHVMRVISGVRVNTLAEKMVLLNRTGIAVAVAVTVLVIENFKRLAVLAKSVTGSS